MRRGRSLLPFCPRILDAQQSEWRETLVVNREIKRLMRSFADSGDTSPDEDDATLLDKLHLVGGSISSVC